MSRFQLDIKGYYRDAVRDKIPSSPGVYFVYRGVLNNSTRKCTLKELIYIGESENMHVCLNEHVRRPDFLAKLRDGEMLFYTYTKYPLKTSDRMQVAASLIHELTPMLNNLTDNRFDYSETTIDIIGDRHAFIPETIHAPSY